MSIFRLKEVEEKENKNKHQAKLAKHHTRTHTRTRTKKNALAYVPTLLRDDSGPKSRVLKTDSLPRRCACVKLPKWTTSVNTWHLSKEVNSLLVQKLYVDRL